MTQPLISEEHVDPKCSDHPHCPFCGGVQVETATTVECVSCGTVAPIGDAWSAERWEALECAG